MTTHGMCRHKLKNNWYSVTIYCGNFGTSWLGPIKKYQTFLFQHLNFLFLSIFNFVFLKQFEPVQNGMVSYVWLFFHLVCLSTYLFTRLAGCFLNLIYFPVSTGIVTGDWQELSSSKYSILSWKSIVEISLIPALSWGVRFSFMYIICKIQL